MNKIATVARWEFTTTVARRAYIFAVAGMPLLYVGLFAITGLSGRSAVQRAAQVPSVIVDRAGIVDLDFAEEQAALREARRGLAEAPGGERKSLIAEGDLDRALARLVAREVSDVYLIDQDYLQTGRITAYSRDAGILAQPLGQQRMAQVVDAIRASLLRQHMSGDALARAYTPALNMVRLQVDASGQAQDALGAGGLGRLTGSVGVLILLTVSIFFSSSFLQQATVEDRQNRVIEILLSSVDADELLMGKVLGLGAAGLLQVAIYVLLVIVPGTVLFSMFQVPVSTMGLMVVYYVLGYLVFASLMGGTGMLARTSQEAAQVSAMWTMVAMSPILVFSSISAEPNGLLARALSYFPLTSPVTMILRLTSTDVPAVDIVLSIVVGALSAYGLLRLAARVFRVASLMYGKRPSLPELLRWLKAA